jgi:two-component system sensor histidine kinase KdpD
LGLAICRAIVETHEGRIWVEPARPGAAQRGARFCFTLPLGTPPTMPVEEEDESVPEANAA